MLMEMREILNWRNQDVSKEILLDLVRKDVAEFNDKFYHFQYAALEMFQGALNNYSMLKFFFFINTHVWQCIVKASSIFIMQLLKTPNHIIYRRIAPKQGQINVNMINQFFLPQLLLLRSFFPFIGKLKDIIHSTDEINNIIQCNQFSCRILLLLPLIAPNAD